MLFDRDVSATVAVSAPVERVWRVLVATLGADTPGALVTFGELRGRVRDAVPGDGLVVRATLGVRRYELVAHLVPHGRGCDLTVAAAADDRAGIAAGGRWHHHRARRHVRQIVRDLVAAVARDAENTSLPAAS